MTFVRRAHKTAWFAEEFTLQLEPHASPYRGHDYHHIERKDAPLSGVDEGGEWQYLPATVYNSMSRVQRSSSSSSFPIPCSSRPIHKCLPHWPHHRSSKAAVAEAKIAAISAATNFRYETTTNTSGEYYLTNLPLPLFKSKSKSRLQKVYQANVILHVQDALKSTSK